METLSVLLTLYHANPPVTRGFPSCKASNVDVSWLGILFHDDVIKWKHFPRYWPFVRGIHRSPVNSPHKSQWRGALMFSLMCARINSWVNNREAGDLRRYRHHYDVIVMLVFTWTICWRKRRVVCKIETPWHSYDVISLEFTSTCSDKRCFLCGCIRIYIYYMYIYWINDFWFPIQDFTGFTKKLNKWIIPRRYRLTSISCPLNVNLFSITSSSYRLVGDVYQ